MGSAGRLITVGLCLFAQAWVLVAALDYGSDEKIDRLFVTVLDGPYAGYSNIGTFEKGNITYKPDSLCE